jgi:hypothetical protein
MDLRIQTLIDALAALKVMVPDRPEPKPISQFSVKESSSLEEKQSETVECVEVHGDMADVMIQGFEGSPLEVKQQCRMMLAGSRFTERGYDLLTAFEREMVSIATGLGWDQVDGTQPLDFEEDKGMTPVLCYSQLGYWVALWSKAVSEGDANEAARLLPIAALCKTVADAARPGRWQREGEPDLETMKAT